MADLLIGVVERLHDTLGFPRGVEVVGRGLAGAGQARIRSVAPGRIL